MARVQPMLNRFAAISGDMKKTGPTILAVVGALVITPGAALAQNSARDAALAAYASASPPSNSADQAAANNEIGADESAMLGNALTFDPTTRDSMGPVKQLRLPSLSTSRNAEFNRISKSDGTSTAGVKQPLPIDWDAKVGADLGYTASGADGYQINRPLPASRDSGTGAAWASVGVVPNLASIDARVDPNSDQGKLGTTFKHSVPLGSRFSVTLQNSYSVTETFSPSGPASSDLPMMTAPVASTPATPQVWGSEKAAKFDILPTGTTFGAGLASTSTDPVTHRTLSAEQKLYGPLELKTAVTDIGQTYASKSISARFKLNW
jgi:hypothetical protein